MRSELKLIIEGAPAFADHEIDETLVLCRRLVSSHWQATHGPLADLREDDQEAIEVIADTNFRVFHEVQFVWHYGQLRLFGILEGLIDQDFLRSSSWSLGLQARLRAMRALGYSLAEEDSTALLNWSRLRNALAHKPPLSIGGVRLEEKDVSEFAALLQRVLDRWRTESQEIIPKRLDYSNYVGC